MLGTGGMLGRGWHVHRLLAEAGMHHCLVIQEAWVRGPHGYAQGRGESGGQAGLQFGALVGHAEGPGICVRPGSTVFPGQWLIAGLWLSQLPCVLFKPCRFWLARPLGPAACRLLPWASWGCLVGSLLQPVGCVVLRSHQCGAVAGRWHFCLPATHTTSFGAQPRGTPCQPLPQVVCE